MFYDYILTHSVQEEGKQDMNLEDDFLLRLPHFENMLPRMPPVQCHQEASLLIGNFKWKPFDTQKSTSEEVAIALDVCAQTYVLTSEENADVSH